MGQGNIIGKPNLPATTGSKGLWNLREQYAASRDSKWPGYDPQWSNTTLLLKTALTDTFTDSSTNNYTVTRGGDTSQTIFTPYEPTGYWSNHFDGNGDYLSCAGNNIVNFGSANFTVEAWVNLNAMPTSDAWPTNWSSHMVVVECGSVNAGDGNAFIIGQTKLIFHSNDTPYLSGNHNMVSGRWYHIALTRNGNVLYFFVDGYLIGTAAISGSVGTGADTYIGCETSQGAWFNGHISNLRVTKSAVYTLPARTTTQPSIVTSGLVAYYDGNNTNSYSGSGSTWTNLVAGGSAYNATISGATFDSSELGHFTFNGSNSVSLPSPVQDNMTLSCWFRTTSSAGSASQWYTGCALLSGEVGGITNDYGLGIGAGRVMFGTGNGDVSAISPLAYNDGQWHYAVGVRTRSTGSLQLYVDGALVATATGQTGSLTATTTVYMGKHPGEANGFVGNVAAALIYNTALTAEQVTTNYNAIRTRFVAFTPPTAPLTAIANTSLLTCQDNRFRDNSTNNFTLTKYNEASVSSFGPFPWTWSAASGGGAYFDGTGDFLSAPNAAANFTNQNFTAECWQWFTTNSIGYQPIMGNTGTADYQGWIVVTETNNLVYCYISTNGANWTHSLGAVYQPPTNAWVHFALVRNGATVTLYANGVSIGSTNIGTASIHSPSGAFYAGYYPYFPGGARSLTGYMANIRLVTGTAIYTANFTPPASPVTAVSGTTLLLNAANVTSTNWHTSTGLPIRAFGNPARSTVVPYVDYATSTYFNGSTDWLNIPATPLCGMGAGDFTLECWFYKTTSNLDVLIDTRNGAGGNALGMALYVQSNTLKAGNDAERIAGGAITNNTWNHCAVVRSGNTLNLYLNGTRTNSVAWTTAAATSCSPLIGKSAANEYTGGFLAGVRILRSAAYTGTTYTVPVRPATPTNDTALLLNQTPATWDATNRNALTSTGTVVATPAMFTGSALSLNGSQVARAYSAGTLSTNFGFGTGDFCIEAWVYPTAVTGADRCLWDTRAAAGDAGMVVFIDTNGKLSNYTSGAIRLTSTPALAANTWQHIAVVRVAGTLAYFINGQPAGAVAYTTTIDCPGQVNIGIRFDNAAGFSGQMDELRVTKGNGRYVGAFSPTTAPFDRDWEPPYNDTLVTSNVLQVKSIDLPGATNNVFRDDSTNNFTPVRNGDVTQGSFSPYIPSGYWSCHFDGAGDYIQAPSTTTLNFGTADFTVEAWINLNTTSGGQSIIAGTAGGCFGFRYGTVWSGGSPGLSIYKGSTADCENVTFPFVPGRWYHVAVSRQSGTVRFFVDGTLLTTAGSGYNGYNVPVENNVRIGTSDVANSEHFNGHISNVRVTKSALYTASFTPPTAPLTAGGNTTLLACQDNRFISNGTTSLTFTRTGDVAVSRLDPFPLAVPVTTVATTNPGSVYFDGTDDRIEVAANNAFLLGSGNFTHEFWIKTTRTSNSWVTGYGVSNPTAGNQMSYLVVLSGGTFYFDMVSGGGTETLVSYGTTAQISDGNWHHLAVTREGNTVRTFRDGTLSQTITYTATIQDPGSGTPIYRVGGFSGTYERPYDGSISNLRLVKGAALYTASFTPPTAPLTAIANTSLLICHDPGGFTDASTNNFTVTKYGDAVARAESPFQVGKLTTYAYGGSGYFDGTGDYLTAPLSSGQFGTNDFTVEAWVLPISKVQIYPTVWANYTSWASGAFALGVDSNSGTAGRYNVVLNPGGVIINSTSPVQYGTWNHLAIVRQSGVIKLYVNGINEGGSYSYSSAIDGNGVVSVGRSDIDSTTFHGHISNLRVVKGTAVYTANFTPPTSPVTAISGTSLLLNFDNAGVYDATGQRNLLTRGATATSTTSRKYEVATQSFNNTDNTVVATTGSVAPFVFGTGDFCIEFWANRNSTAQEVLYDQRPLNTQGAYPTIYCEGATLYYYVNSGNQINGGTLAAGTWYHVAVCRAASQTRLFVNGVQQGVTYADTNSYLCGAGRPLLGNGFRDGTTDYRINSYIEGLRVSRVGRYTANFTPPSEPFPVA